MKSGEEDWEGCSYKQVAEGCNYKQVVQVSSSPEGDIEEFLLWLSSLRTQLVSMRAKVQSLASLSGLIWCCHELWCRSQTQLRPCVAVAQAGSWSSNLTPSLGASICLKCSLKKAKKKKKKKKKKRKRKKKWHWVKTWAHQPAGKGWWVFYAEEIMQRAQVRDMFNRVKGQ